MARYDQILQFIISGVSTGSICAKDGGLSILLAEQNARAALRIADRGYVLEGGKITIEGTAEQLLSNEGVRAAYLGGKSR